MMEGTTQPRHREQQLMNETQLLARRAETGAEIGEGSGEERGEQRAAGRCEMAQQDLSLEA